MNQSAGDRPSNGAEGSGAPTTSRAPIPPCPATVEQTGVSRSVLSGLALKLASTTFDFTTEWAADRLRLPTTVVGDLLREHAEKKWLEVLGEVAPFNHRFAISERGREMAARLHAISGYVGPAPVSVETYRGMLDEQLASMPRITPQDVRAAIEGLVLPEEAVRVASVATASGRSLFVFGPPGNGKTSLGMKLHGALSGDLWIPHCIGVDESILRVFDPLCHKPVGGDDGHDHDRRWLKIRRPLVLAGGELSLQALDLTFNHELRFYEVPLHVKANGGLLLVDDFGRQRVEPHQLLNRWIVPLEYAVDHLTLHTGQMIEVPFQLMLVVATNLDPKEVTDSAFRRRIGYSLRLGSPTAADYERILSRYAAERGLAVPPGLSAHLLERYRLTSREMSASDPRNLVDRVVDFCTFSGFEAELTEEYVDQAWSSYFGGS